MLRSSAQCAGVLKPVRQMLLLCPIHIQGARVCQGSDRAPIPIAVVGSGLAISCSDVDK